MPICGLTWGRTVHRIPEQAVKNKGKEWRARKAIGTLGKLFKELCYADIFLKIEKILYNPDNFINKVLCAYVLRYLL